MKPVDGMPWPWIQMAMSTWFTSRTPVTNSGTASMTGQVGVPRESKIAGRPTAGTFTWSSTATMSFTSRTRPTPVRVRRWNTCTTTAPRGPAPRSPRAPCSVRLGLPSTRTTIPTSPMRPTGNTAATASALLRMTEPVGRVKGSISAATEVVNRPSSSTGTTTSTSPTRTAVHRN